MAIDTVNKRRSVGALRGRFLAPLADGAITAPDRLQFARQYSGIPAGGAPPPDPTTPGNGWGKAKWWGIPFRFFHMNQS